MFKCSHCGTTQEYSFHKDVNGNQICSDCAEELCLVECRHCDRLVAQGDINTTDDDVELCSECYENETVSCARCGDVYYDDDDLYYAENYGDVCESCRDEYFRYCESCDCLYPEGDGRACSDDEWRCSSCADDYEENNGECDGGGILSHSARIPTIFHYAAGESQHKFVYGVELEVDKGGSSSSQANAVREMMHQNVICKSDGSINNGFEIVSYPGSLAWHKEIPWKEMMSRLVQNGYRSHDTDTCGVHIHINRDCLGNGGTEQDRVIAKMILFFEMNWKSLVVFSRRKEENLQRWASRYGIRKKDTPEKLLDKAKNGNRYQTVNLCNNATVEIRMFRGTLNHRTLIAALELVDGIVRFCKSKPVAEVQGCTLPILAKFIDSPNFTGYLENRKLMDAVCDEVPDFTYECGDIVTALATDYARELQDSSGSLLVGRRLEVIDINGDRVRVAGNHCNNVWIPVAELGDLDTEAAPVYEVGDRVMITHDPYNITGYDLVHANGTVVEVASAEAENQQDGRYLVELENDYAFMFHETCLQAQDQPF